MTGRTYQDLPDYGSLELERADIIIINTVIVTSAIILLIIILVFIHTIFFLESLQISAISLANILPAVLNANKLVKGRQSGMFQDILIGPGIQTRTR